MTNIWFLIYSGIIWDRTKSTRIQSRNNSNSFDVWVVHVTSWLKCTCRLWTQTKRECVGRRRNDKANQRKTAAFCDIQCTNITRSNGSRSSATCGNASREGRCAPLRRELVRGRKVTRSRGKVKYDRSSWSMQQQQMAELSWWHCN